MTAELQGLESNVLVDMILAELAKLLKGVVLSVLAKLDAYVDTLVLGQFEAFRPYIKAGIKFLIDTVTAL